LLNLIVEIRSNTKSRRPRESHQIPHSSFFLCNGSHGRQCRQKLSSFHTVCKEPEHARYIPCTYANQLRERDVQFFHGDLKSDNVLVGGLENAPLEQATIKIADFGESHFATEEGKRKGTIPYMAPEVWTKNFEKMADYNWMNADVWSFGVVCWELLTACSTGYRSPLAYKDMKMDTPASLEQGLLLGKRLPRPKFDGKDQRLPILFDALITSCWQFECGSRPDWQSIILSISNFQNLETGIAGDKRNMKAGVSEARAEFPKLREISWSDIACGDFIDEGAFGAVYKGKWQNKEVAIKKLLIKAAGKRLVQDMYGEAQFLCQVVHVNVVLLHGVCFEAPNFAIILEYAAPSLHLLLSDVDAFPIGDQFLAALEISRGMAAIHAAGILHHDLRAANVLMGPEGNRRCRITDFGLSKTKIQSSRFSTKTSGNPGWSAPEYLAGNVPFTNSCDVFSLGVVMFEMSSDPPGLPPFEGQSGDNIRNLYLEGKRPLLRDGVDRDFAQILQLCWDQDPSKRPTFFRIVQIIEISGKAAKKYTV
jgi:serine/threonine protein kinase